MAAADARVHEVSFFVQRFVRLCDDVTVLFVRRQIIDVIGDHARLLVHLAVRRHDEAELVDLRKGRERGNKTDVLTFGRLDRAHTSVVRVVHVAHFEGRAVAVETAGTERGELALVREFCDRVGLIHELRELGRAEELADDRRNGTYVDEGGGRDFHGIRRRHALLDQTLQTGHADAELVLQQFAHRTHAAVAEVVDLVDGPDPVLQVEVGRNGGDDIVHRDALVVEFFHERLDELLFRGRYAHDARLRFEVHLRGLFAVVAGEQFMEELARRDELETVVPALFAVFFSSCFSSASGAVSCV